MTRFIGGACVAVLLAVVAPARADVFTFDLPDLLGEYRWEDLSAGGVWRDVDVTTLFDPQLVRNASVVLKGTVTPGVMRGDGVAYPPDDVVLRGVFSPGLATERMSYAVFKGRATDGDFASEDAFGPPYYLVDPLPGPGTGPWLFTPRITVGLGPAMLDIELPPRLDGNNSPDPWLWCDGFAVVTPLVGTITHAQLVVETVPEPATIALVGFGMALLLRRRC